MEYGKIVPHFDPDPWLLPAYRWLGRYCGYCPQIWLTRGRMDNTGIRRPKNWGGYRRREYRDQMILFGFDFIRGFPVDYGFWETHLVSLACNTPPATPATDVEIALIASLDRFLRYRDETLRDDPQAFSPSDWLCESAWEQHRDLARLLKEFLFVENDQVVVPSLNLKAAKIVICRNERQKKTLRRLGFIEDRITIRNLPG